jgi:hypothetical protein
LLGRRDVRDGREAAYDFDAIKLLDAAVEEFA